MSHLDFFGLEAFVAIAERGSFHAAAAHLNLSQTALSHRLRKFEDGLGVRLLNRTTRQVALTAAGADLLPRGRRVLDDMRSAVERLSADAARKAPAVAFGCLPTIAMVILPAILAGFRARNPETSVRVFDSSASEIADRVQAGDAEFGVTVVAANRWDLDLRPVVKEPFMLLCRRDDPLAGRRAVNWAEIGASPLIRISAETGNRILIDDALGNRREALNWRYEVQRVTTAVALVSAGVGYAVLPKLAARAVDASGLAAISLASPTVTRTLGVVTRGRQPLTPVASSLLDAVVEGLKEGVGGPSITEIRA